MRELTASFQRELTASLDRLIHQLEADNAETLSSRPHPSVDLIEQWVGRRPATRTFTLVTAPDGLGLLAEITRIFADQGVNIHYARCRLAQGGQARIAIAANAAARVTSRITAAIEALPRQISVQVLSVVHATSPSDGHSPLDSSLDSSLASFIEAWVGPRSATHIVTQVTAPDRPGLLADIIGIFADQGVNILRAWSGLAQDGQARIAIEAGAAKEDAYRIVEEAIKARFPDYDVREFDPGELLPPQARNQ
jgi:glycine cleavage system regulatory protein